MWATRVQKIDLELSPIQTEINRLNTDFISEVSKTSQTPPMPDVPQGSSGLITKGALLGFVNPASRLNAIETCEGNVQLSYFDTQGRMRQTNYDATSDSKSATFEQWIPDAQRVCLNCSNSNGVIKLDKSLFLPASTNWTIEAWFFYPLPATKEWNTLISGRNQDCHICVRNGSQLGIYLNDDPLGQKFYDCGFNLKSLSQGWHHLTSVGREDTTLFYIDGKSVGTAPITIDKKEFSGTKAKALADAQAKLAQNPNDATAKQQISAIENATLKVSSDIYAIANDQAAMPPVGTSAMQFDGVDDYVEIAHSPALDLTDHFTIEAWIKLDTLGGRIVDKNIGGGGGCFTFDSYQGLRFGNKGVDLHTTPDQLKLGIWQHVAVVFDYSAKIAKLFINGAEVDTKTPTQAGESKNLPIRIGAQADNPKGSLFKGAIAEVRIWNKARTAEEIRVDMNKRLSGKESNLVAYYPLNEITSSTQQVSDLSSNGNKGTVTGATIVADQTPLLGEQFGKLAEVRIWGIALTEEEIAVNSKTLLTGNEPDLLAYYPFNEATGTDIQDRTGNGNNSTIMGASWWGCTAPIGKLDDNQVMHGKVLNLAGVAIHNDGFVDAVITVNDSNSPFVYDALVSAEYSTVILDSSGKKTAIMRRFFAYPANNAATLLPDKRIEALELKWIGNAQFAPTLLGYIEGAPPIPSENLTFSDDYNKATSVSLTTSEDVAYKWNRSQDVGGGAKLETFIGTDTETFGGIGVATKIEQVKAGFKGDLDTKFQEKRETSITSSSSLGMADKLELRGTPEQSICFPQLGKRFIPKNIGYALVVSALADVFVTRLARSGKMVGYQVQPIEEIPPDINTITFLINPAYTMNGSLDGLTGSSATSDRFFKHVPAMRSQYGSLYPASYYRLQEAYALKQAIETEDKRRESYFKNFDVLVDETSLTSNVDEYNSYEVTLLPFPSGESALPSQGNKLIAIAQDGQNTLYFRIFDNQGTPANYQEKSLGLDKSQKLSDLKEALKNYWATPIEPVPEEILMKIKNEAISIRDSSPPPISVQREEDKSTLNNADGSATDPNKPKVPTVSAETQADSKKMSSITQIKQDQIQSKVDDENKRVHATERLSDWQTKMENIKDWAGKRNIVNTYVWDADGGLRSESQSFADTVEHSVGTSFEMNAGLGYEGDITVCGIDGSLTAQATVNLTQTMTKTETRGYGLKLDVDLSGLESKGITDYQHNPLLPGEKVSRYRFMSFYLEGSTNNFSDFFNYVVDPEWLASNDENARALRQAQAKPNKTWRVLHRVTYVERPALMGFGRDLRKVQAVAQITDQQALLDKIAKLEEHNKNLESKLDQIIEKLDSHK